MAGEKEQGLRLYVDDVRFPPDKSWTLARTAEEALSLMQQYRVDVVSLDCDLDLREKADGAWISVPAKDGIWLVEQMIKHDLLPPRIPHIRVHSQNPEGGPRMKEMLREAIAKKRDQA